MDIAIVTGAETTLGLSLIQRLLRQGYRVHGIGNNFSRITFADPRFFAHAVDLSDLNATIQVMEKILQEEKSLDLLLHAIDVTPGAAFESLPVGNLEAVLKIGLLGPVMLTRLALPNLLRFRGQLINIIPTNKSGAPASAVNALLEGGLRAMNRALFDDARDAGLRVTNLILRQNSEPDALCVQSSEQTHIDLEDVARAVEQLLDPNLINVASELVLHPRNSAHANAALPEMPLPPDPYKEVVLPPKAYCPPEQPKIPTQAKEKTERTIPYTDDEMEDKVAAAIEDFEAHPERYELSKRQARKSAQTQRGDHKQKTPPGDSHKSKRRRGRRRGGRNQNRKHEDQRPPKAQAGNDASPSKDSPPPQGEHATVPSKDSPPQNQHTAAPSKDSLEKPKEAIAAAPKKEKAETAPKKATTKKVAQRASKTARKSTPTKVAAKKATKKSAKKATKKKAVKKAAKKKAVKKVKLP